MSEEIGISIMFTGNSISIKTLLTIVDVLNSEPYLCGEEILMALGDIQTHIKDNDYIAAYRDQKELELLGEFVKLQLM